jgi:hypothetical protein
MSVVSALRSTKGLQYHHGSTGNSLSLCNCLFLPRLVHAERPIPTPQETNRRIIPLPEQILCHYIRISRAHKSPPYVLERIPIIKYLPGLRDTHWEIKQVICAENLELGVDACGK